MQTLKAAPFYNVTSMRNTRLLLIISFIILLEYHIDTKSLNAMKTVNR